MTDIVPIRRALISLSDKTGLEELAAGLAKARGGAGVDRRHGGQASRDWPSKSATLATLPAFRR